MLRDFSIKSLDVLARERDSLGTNFEQVLLQLYDISKFYHTSKDDEDSMKKMISLKL